MIRKYRNFLAMLPVLAVGMCQHDSIGSILGGECKLSHTPEFAVLGKTGYDQIWINRTTESLVTGCNQPRPKARPASLDKPMAVKAPPAKSKSRIRRWLGA
jgi:hypothetical protein